MHQKKVRGLLLTGATQKFALANTSALPRAYTHPYIRPSYSLQHATRSPFRTRPAPNFAQLRSPRQQGCSLGYAYTLDQHL